MRPCRAAMLLLCASLLPGVASAQPGNTPSLPDPPRSTSPVGSREPSSVRADAGRVIDLLVRAYGNADLAPLVDYLRGTTEASPNDVVPLLSLGHGFLNRFETSGDRADFSRALGFFEIPAEDDVFPAWGNRWATSITLSHLMKGALRLRRLVPDDAVLATRVDVLWERVARLAADEADRKLADEPPSLPYDSSSTGDSKAEENAWEAAFLAWSSGLYPDHPRAPAWEEKARLLASLSIVRPSDHAFFKGLQVATVHDDLTLENHGYAPNPYYAVGTLMLLRMGSLAYRMTGRPVPAEFGRNVSALHERYRGYCALEGERWTWSLPSDPVGDPSLFPLPGLDAPERVRSLVSQRLREGTLWLPGPPAGTLVPEPGAGLTPDSAFARAVQDAKVAWYYLDGTWLWLDPALEEPRRTASEPIR
ncbi:MAG: hypothetical protein U0529_04980 [Thermoanaerobaculia bacterium]